MKANPAPELAQPFVPLRTSLAVAAGAAVLLVASCAPPRVVPAPAPTQTSRPAPAPPPTATGPKLDWRDAPITPGDWRWGSEGGQSVARFAGGLLVLRCDSASRTVTLQRPGAGTGPVPFTVITAATTRQLSATPQPGTPPYLALNLPARDPLLDAMAFSRGRFAVETAGLPTLYVPSWPEVGRVVEDCR